MTATRVRNVSNRRVGSADDRAVRHYVREFIVETNDPKDGPIIAISACGIYRGQPYVTERESDLGALAVAIRAEPVPNSQCTWAVTCDYSSRSADPEKFGAGAGGPGSTGGQSSQTDPNDNPISWRADREWSTRKMNEVIEQDKDGKPIVNTAGDKFDPPLEIERSITILVIERNEVLYDPSLSEKYENRVNSKKFYGAAPGQAKVESITAREDFKNGIRFARVRYEVHFKRWPYTRIIGLGANNTAPFFAQTEIGGWNPVWLLNLGSYEISSGNRIQCVDSKGNPYSVPVPLDGNGAQLSATATTPYRIFNPFHEVDFGPLKLEF